MTGLYPHQIVKHLKAGLDGWARGYRGQVHIAKDAWIELELLAESPVGFRVIVHWAGDKNAGNQDGIENLPLVTALLQITLSNNLGLTAKPEQALAENVPGRQMPILKLLGLARERILKISWPESVAESIRYVGCDPVGTPDGVPLAAYVLTFELDHALPDYESDAAPETMAD
jgi:hypothetical protein